MQLIRHLPERGDKPTAIAIGNFDGMHRGHQAVVQACVLAAQGKGLVPSVLTFEPHPRRFFGKAEPAFRIERLGVKLQRLTQASIARVYMPRFDASFAGLSADQFLNDVLGRSLQAKVVVTGADFAFGKGRAGTIETLRAWGVANGVEIIAVPPVVDQGTICSSTAIRDALTQGDMRRIAAILGRDYALVGTVVHGDGRGAGLGFPTANIALPSLLKHPAHGVYAIRGWVRGVPYDGVANLGVKPTVSAANTPTLEVHLFDEMGNIYGQHMEVHFIEKLRDEQKFESLDALITQIAHDCVAAKAVLQSYDKAAKAKT